MGSCPGQVAASLQRSGVAQRERRWTPDRDRRVAELYLGGMTVEQVAEAVGSSTDRICTSLRRSGVPAQSRGLKGPRHPNWKGGRRLDKDGYVLVYAPDHPHAVNGTVREHRLVMERIEGRYLDPEEVVDHRDGDKQNNAPENLHLYPDNATHLRETLRGLQPN